MVHDTATGMNIAKHALPTHPANCMMVSSVMDATIGFTLLALAGKSMAVFKSNGQQDLATRCLAHPCSSKRISVDVASTIFLVHTHDIHYLHLSVPEDIPKPPSDEDESVTDKPEQRGESNPISDSELVG
jgi:hypothetical protein